MTRIDANLAEQDILIGADMFEQSPYRECYGTSDVTYGVYAGRFYPKRIGSDPVSKYWALRRTAAMFDVPEKPLQIDGPDAVGFLEHVFSRRISTLKEGRGRYALACTPAGGIFMDGLLFKMSRNRFWYVQADGDFESWLLAHSAAFDVTITDPKSRVIQIQGPQSLEIMRKASGGVIDENMGYFHADWFDLGGQELFVSRTGWTGELGFEIYSLGGRTDHKRLWDHLVKAGTPFGMEISSTSASMGPRRIEAGILNNGSDMDSSMTPFQAGLGSFIDLDKEHFVGRKVLLEADRRPLLYGVKCRKGTPNRQDEVFFDNQSVGFVTAAAWSPTLESGIGFVRFSEPADWAGRIVSVKTRFGATFSGEVVELPFYDREKNIARGLVQNSL